MSEACPFCAVLFGRAPAHRIAETPTCLAFLDARPLFDGHVLVIPREHVPDFTALPIEQVGPLFLLAQRVVEALQRGLEAQGAFVALNHRVSQSVPHLHLHVVPRRQGDGLRGFFWPRHKYASEGAAEAVAERIRRALPQAPSGERIG